MATITEPGPSTAAVPARGFLPFRLTIDRYHQMVASGVLTEKDPVFLWKGHLVEKMTKGRSHTFTLISLDKLLDRLVPAGWFVGQEQPITIADDGIPEPDLTVIRGTVRDYLERAPTAQEVALVVEVADSSVWVDSGEVLATYALAAIPVYWIVNLPKRRVEVYSLPSGPAEAPFYREQRNFGPDDEVPVILDGREVGRIAVREILP